ncbi:MAG: metal ABC transporter permease [Chitinispirillaceae bacterium]|nr:metal ABC transporter permease [Chitinispirillaceae bacterium]
MLELMIVPFCAAVLLTGIFAYLGVHIIQRQVIFVDLALAQIAALGAMAGLFFGVHLHSANTWLFALPFTIAGAAIFALTRLKGRAVPQEAVIGVVYVVATSASIILLNSSPSESEHIKHMLVGNILFSGWQDIFRLALCCGAVGLFHFAFRKRFMAVSGNPDNAGLSSAQLRLWDFLFYISLGLVVTVSVEIAGVLLIFSYLVVPASCAMLLTGSAGRQLALGWLFGIAVSVVGLICSAAFDLPTGAAIVCTFGILFMVVIIAVLIKKS